MALTTSVVPERPISKVGPQPGILGETAAHGQSLEWRLVGDAQEALARLREIDPQGAVIGIGAPLASALGIEVEGLRPFARRQGEAGMPETQHALWAFLTRDDASSAFDAAQCLSDRLAPNFSVVNATALFRYRDARDLSGFRDGLANPVGAAAANAALIAGGPRAGGSFALVQRYIYFHRRLLRRDSAERSQIVGRDAETDAELAEAPVSAHVRRTEQESFGPDGFMLRRSMPWGDARRHGLQFIAFMRNLDLAERMLDRMTGAADGVRDAILSHAQAETGGFYFCPPLRDGRLDLALPARAAAPSSAGTLERVAGPEASILFEARRCIHSRNCVLSRPDVFVPNVEGAWLHPDRASGAEIAALAQACPSGAIRYERHDGGVPEAPPNVNVVRVLENGPLAIRAEATIGAVPALRATLCRCGGSAAKPYCDGSHHRIEFRGTGEPEPRAVAALERGTDRFRSSRPPTGRCCSTAPLRSSAAQAARSSAASRQRSAAAASRAASRFATALTPVPDSARNDFSKCNQNPEVMRWLTIRSKLRPKCRSARRSHAVNC
jgi:putative iron-dependent peroxidase